MTRLHGRPFTVDEQELRHLARLLVRRSALPLTDAVAWGFGLGAGVATRYDWDLELVPVEPLLAAMVLGAALLWTLGIATGLYRGRHLEGTADEAVLLAGVFMTVGLAVLVVDVVLPVPIVPRSVPLLAAFVALVLAGAVRATVRTMRLHRTRRAGDTAQRVVIYGAGACGQALVRAMTSGGEPGYEPVALLDDDPALRLRRICGVPVCGSRLAVADVARRRRADLLVIAIRAADPLIIREVTSVAAAVGLTVKTLPPLSERLVPSVQVSDLQDIDVNTLLGRTPLETDLSSVSAYLAGRRVLVTGAGGSIGSELCRQISRFGPAELLMLDRDESALHAVQLSIYGKALLDSPDVILADIRDFDAIETVFDSRRPEVVFHAAALKHLPMLEQYPDEAWKTNVLGTAHVLEAAARHHVERLVNISTDKAANPMSVLGYSKRIGERLVADVAARAAGPFLSVRFGNVLGSRGSVLATFWDQIAAGRPLTITHPEVSRFFMTIPEAVALVIQAGAIGRGGDVLVLDMGARIRIVDVAHQLMGLAGTTSPIVYTGLREGEKLHEDLFGSGEADHRPTHPAISEVPVPALPVDDVVRRPVVSSATSMAQLCVDDESPLGGPVRSLVLKPAGPGRNAAGSGQP